MSAVDIPGDPVRRRILEPLADGGAGADPDARAAAPATIAACAGTPEP